MSISIGNRPNAFVFMCDERWKEGKRDKRPKGTVWAHIRQINEWHTMYLYLTVIRNFH